MLTRLYIIFSDTQGLLTPQSVVKSGCNFYLIRALMVILVTCKNKDFHIVNCPFLDGNVPSRLPSHLIRVARVCSHVVYFNARINV